MDCSHHHPAALGAVMTGRDDISKKLRHAAPGRFTFSEDNLYSFTYCGLEFVLQPVLFNNKSCLHLSQRGNVLEEGPESVIDYELKYAKTSLGALNEYINGLRKAWLVNVKQRKYEEVLALMGERSSYHD